MNILAIISPLIMVALLGFICSKSQWLTRPQLDAISKFTFQICIPAFLFYKMATANFSEQVSWQLFAAFYLPVLVCYTLMWLVNYYFFPVKNQQIKTTDSAVFALGASYSNTIIVGLPVLLAAIGEQVIGIIFLIITFHSAMLFALTSAIAARSSAQASSKNDNDENKHFNWLNFLKNTFNNPLIISILSGLIVNLLNISLPVFISESLLLISKPAITLALFILGASLAFYQVRSNLTLISIACVGKLVLLPFLVFITAKHIFTLEPLIITVLVVLSACPTGVNAYLVAKSHSLPPHQQGQQIVASTVVVSTLLCIVTIPLWLMAL